MSQFQISSFTNIRPPGSLFFNSPTRKPKRRNLRYTEQIIRDPRIGEYTGQKIVQKLTQHSLVTLEQMMNQYSSFKITQFLRFFLKLLEPRQQQQIFLAYGLFRLFKDLCKGSKITEITFGDISAIITDRMPHVNQDMKIRQKLLPRNLQFPEQFKEHIIPPDIEGKILQERQRLHQTPCRFDKIQHTNRRIAKAAYSESNNLFFSVDSPSSQINILNGKLQTIGVLKTELEISKRESIITQIVWSEAEQRIAALNGNFSISMWAKQDTYRFEVNVPIPTIYLPNPYVMIGYMESSRKWYAIDNHPIIHILSSHNFEPETTFKHSKLRKLKSTQKLQTIELKYRKLICLAFERNIFLISLDRKQITTEITNFPTSVTSLTFSEAYQAMFVSTYENYFTSFQLSQYLDLTQRGKFEGHKGTISLLGTLQNKPVVFSLQQSSILKLWDIRDFQCFQTFSVLKNILYSQVLTMPDAICLVGSKLYIYKWRHELIFRQPEKVLLMSILAKQFLVVTNKTIKLYNHYSGALLKVYQGIYGQTDIYTAYLVDQRSRLIISDQEGNLIIYDSSDMATVQKRKLGPRPSFFSFDEELEILTYCCMGDIYICEYVRDKEITLRRKILNQGQLINTLEVSGSHDLLCVNYANDQNLYFYIFQKGKIAGYLRYKHFVGMKFIPDYHMFVVLSQKQIQVVSYKRNISDTWSFFIHVTIDLWNPKSIQQLGVPVSNSKVNSFNLTLFDYNIVVASEDAGIYTIFETDFEQMNRQINGEKLPKYRQNYNPYRISTQSHSQTVITLNNAIIVDRPFKRKIQHKVYWEHMRSQARFACRVGDFFMISDSQMNIYLSQIPNQVIGCLNLSETLPLSWDVHHYTEKDLKQIQFVLEFLDNERTYTDPHFSLDDSPTLPKKRSLIERDRVGLTLTNLLLQDKKNQPIKSYKSCSLRQKKIVLEKEREDKQKEQDFAQHRKHQQDQQDKITNRKFSEKQINEAMNYLNINYNDMLLKKGVAESDIHPLVKKLQIKLNSVSLKDQKKSVVSQISKLSGIYTNNQDSPNRRFNSQSNVITRVRTIMQLVQDTKRQFNDPKVLIRKLDNDLKVSKVKNPRNMRQSSLPALKRTQRQFL